MIAANIPAIPPVPVAPILVPSPVIMNAPSHLPVSPVAVAAPMPSLSVQQMMDMMTAVVRTVPVPSVVVRAPSVVAQAAQFC